MSTLKLPVASRPVRLLLLAGFFSIGLLIASAVSMLLMTESDGAMKITWSGVLITSVVQNIVAFIAPVAVLVRLVSARPWQELYLNTAPRWEAVLGVVMVCVVSVPAMNWLTAVNEAVTFPEWLSPLERMFRSMENQALESTRKIIEVCSVEGLIINILVVGVLTGIGEEMFFRGGVQNYIHRGNTPVKPWVAIWVSAFIFSAMHFQFYGFLPRMLLGAYFGYLLVWTRCLWVPVIAHALNNSMAVGGEFMYNKFLIDNDVLTIGEPGTSTEWVAFLSLTGLIIILSFARSMMFRPREESIK